MLSGEFAPATGERLQVIDHVAGAGAGRLARGWTGMLMDEFPASGGGTNSPAGCWAVVSFFASWLASIGYRRHGQEKEQNQALT